ncbi:serine protease [Frigidibacter sp. RF13]|uniref:serine protease n=1 Tax=Frigidibacter sp. RF13 TaxID=2997340 RepID=UPI00226E1E9E|nr:serine protease [Frigidibacter sp. RF13]MCY1127760.1 serine protease [Frigidibacter sp. RF13]
MKRALWTATFLGAAFAATLVHGQDTWVQIEAQPSLTEAEGRARAYAGAFTNVQGYRLKSGWYAIVLGPFTPEEAARQLALLTSERLIPGDSFVATEGELGRRFWPAGLDAAAPAETTAAPEAPSTEPPATEPAAAPTPVLPEETVEEARRSESALSADERMDLQRAMQWFGVYQGAIDGSFGKGTRAAMASWQAEIGAPETGILTTAQRGDLTGRWTAERATMGIERVSEKEAGIDIDLPLGLVKFDGYQPPFAAYGEKDGSGYQVLLISRRGDQKDLVALYERLQAMEIMPMEGARSIGRASFTIDGEGNGKTAHAEAALEGGFIKGFALIAPTDDSARRARVLEAMKASFKPAGSVALDENLGEPSSTTAADLTSGLDIRRPAIARTGAFIDGEGTVLTTSEVLAGCTRVTLDGRTDATVAFEDPTLGFAILKPSAPLAPRAFAALAPTAPRLDSDVALAGYSYEDKLSAPVVSTGTFSEGQGLNGEAELDRLTLTTLAGDAGGAVLNGSGAMIGMLLPKTDEAGRALPKDVSFTLKGAAIGKALEAQGLTFTTSDRTGTLAAEDLAKLARDMTVLVSCWK